jgi:hypothetical protein
MTMNNSRDRETTTYTPVLNSKPCSYFLKLSIIVLKCMSYTLEDKRITTTYIIPVKLDGASFPVLGDTISYLDVGITDGYLGKLKDAIARTGMR